MDIVKCSHYVKHAGTETDRTADSYLSSHMYSDTFILDGMCAESFNLFLPNAIEYIFPCRLAPLGVLFQYGKSIHMINYRHHFISC